MVEDKTQLISQVEAVEKSKAKLDRNRTGD